MRLFGYYALHSFVNQVRKMLKTWVLIFLVVCGLIGGVIGAGAAKLGDMAEEQQAEEQTAPPEETPSLAERLGLAGEELTELAVGGVILAVLVWQCLSADTNGSKIFLPADVNLLFASPMQPQSVLLFRLTTKLGTFLFMGVYLLLQLPNLVLNMGMSLPAAAALIAVFSLTVITGCLLQVLLYLCASNRPGLKNGLRRGFYALAGAVLLGWFLLWRHSGASPLKAAADFFNAPVTRLIPFWGWLKGVFLYAAEGRPAGVLACLAAVLAGDGVLLWAIRRTRADFYEDAMIRSQELAERMERIRAESEGKSAFRKRRKDREDSLRRDSMRYGQGAGVFFFKSLYNRFRFAHLGFFTKTMETYLAAAAAVALLCRFMWHYPSVVPAALTLAGLTFFRTMGNPLEEDTRMDFFLLIPESTWAKLFSSLMGGAVNCLLDVLPALLLAAILAGENPLAALAWLPFIVSVDFYATCVGSFINLSVPGKAGTTLKQMVQVMFIYFGLLPDAALIAVGMVMGWAAPAAVAAAVLNAFLGLLFFGLTPLFLEPGAAREKRRADRETAADPSALPAARRAFSRMGFGTALVLILGSALQLALIRLLPERLSDTWWYLWAVTFAPLYLVSFPLGELIIRKVPARRGEKVSPGPGQLLSLIPICVFFMLAGNYMGVGVNWLIGKLPGAATVNPVEAYALHDDIWMKLLFLTVCAPVMEELLFRRMLIDRMRPYGERLAVVTSAVMFGLFHGNISQFFYAFLLGLVFGYVYLRTGKLRYTAALHMFINFIGSIAGPAVMGKAESAPAQGISPWDLLYAGYAALLMLAGLSGLVLYLIRRRQMHFDPAPLELPREKRLTAVWGNPGMLVLAAVCLAVFCVNIFGL